MRLELIKDVIVGVLKKTLPTNYAHYFLSPEELVAMEEYLKAAKERALTKATTKPWPGENVKEGEGVEAPKKSYMPTDGYQEHYSDSKPMRAYKKILKQFATEGVAHHGHVDFNPKSEQLHVHTDVGREMINRASKGAVSLEKPKAPDAKAAEPKVDTSTVPFFGGPKTE